MTVLNFGVILKSFIIFIGTLLGVLALYACGSDNSSTNSVVTSTAEVTGQIKNSVETPTLPSKSVQSGIPTAEWQYRWLKGIPCYAPCWEGIIPGSTTVNEALTLLGKNTQITSLEKLAAGNGQKGALRWYWNFPNNSSGGEYAGRIFYSSNNRTVGIIYPTYGTISYTLNDVIQVYGEPQLVVATAVIAPEGGSNSYSITFIYTDKGFVVSASFFLERPTKPSVTMDVVLNRGVTFFEPGTQNLARVFLNVNLTQIAIPWQGTQTFEFYCRNYDGGPCMYHL